jgi:2-polyprenyl-3-methyl-5-hydroxy-6-metoxy-1,4-benzoquinol methylase
MSTSKQNKAVAGTKAYYEKYAAEWVRTHSDPFHDEKEFRILIQHLDPRASVIDIGCAGGVLVPLFLGIGKGLRYHGIDIAKKFISIAQNRYPQLPFSVGNVVDKKTLPRKRFDAFIARSVIMHLPLELWNVALENIEGLSKPNAYGYIVLPERRPPSITPSQDQRHFTLLPGKDQAAFMKGRGWKIIKKFIHDSGSHKARWIGYIVQLP